MNSEAPIFVVGVPRSGTTLLTAMLGAHSRLDSGLETHFFAHAKGVRLRRALNRWHWPAGATEFLKSMAGADSTTDRLLGVSRQEIDGFLRTRPPSVQALLESVTATRAVRGGKARWIEKTPNHLLHLDRIRELYPDAQIIRIIRDPRDVALSLRRVPFASSSVIANLYSYCERDRRSWGFFQRDSNSATIRYEDLISSPRASLTALCRFLGESFQERMLQPDAAASVVIGEGEWWKNKVRSTIDRTRTGVWKQEMSEAEQHLASLVCQEVLERYGYTGPVEPRRTLTCQPLSAEFIELNESLLHELAKLRVRLLPWSVGEDGPNLIVGLPGQFRWALGPSVGSRVSCAANTVYHIVMSRLARKTIRWMAETSHLSIQQGVNDRLCDLAVSLTVSKGSRVAVLRELREELTPGVSEAGAGPAEDETKPDEGEVRSG